MMVTYRYVVNEAVSALTPVGRPKRCFSEARFEVLNPVFTAGGFDGVLGLSFWSTLTGSCMKWPWVTSWNGNRRSVVSVFQPSIGD